MAGGLAGLAFSGRVVVEIVARAAVKACLAVQELAICAFLALVFFWPLAHLAVLDPDE